MATRVVHLRAHDRGYYYPTPHGPPIPCPAAPPGAGGFTSVMQCLPTLQGGSA